MRYLKALLILMFLETLVCMDLPAQCCKRVVVKKSCNLAFYKPSSKNRKKKRPKEPAKEKRRNRIFREDVSNKDREEAFIPPYREKRPSAEGKKYLVSLRKLHALQLQFIQSRETLPEDRKNAMLYDLDKEKENLAVPLKEIRNFPYRRTFTSLERVLANLCRKDKINEEQMLLHIQKMQIRSMKKHYSRPVAY